MTTDRKARAAAERAHEATATRDPQIAETIRQQIGHKALYMIGARNLVDHGNGLSLRIRGSKRVNYMRVTLNALDLYDVEFLKVRGVNACPVSEHGDVGAENLRQLIETVTGLYTSF